MSPLEPLPEPALPELALSGLALSGLALPELALPGPALPEPVLPEPVLPELELPEPVLPAPALPEPLAGLFRDPLAPAQRDFVDAATTARLFLPGPPAAYDTGSWLALRADHAAARDAVHADLGVDQPVLADWILRRRPIEVATAAGSLQEYLRRPDRGRQLATASRERLEQANLAQQGPAHLALVLGDGLSAAAASANGPALADALVVGAEARGWAVRQPPILVRRCRVGLLNELGPLLGADVVILLIGERPGLGAADSLSAYLAFRPRPGHSDADRNLVSGIHSRGTPIAVAAPRVLDLAGLLLTAGTSGVAVKEWLGDVELTAGAP